MFRALRQWHLYKYKGLNFAKGIGTLIKGKWGQMQEVVRQKKFLKIGGKMGLDIG
jgi:hypothetical protein